MCEESYLIEGMNKLKRDIQEIKFRIKPEIYPKLKVIMFSRDQGDQRVISN